MIVALHAYSSFPPGCHSRESGIAFMEAFSEPVL
jgi:hypothetical protein